MGREKLFSGKKPQPATSRLISNYQKTTKFIKKVWNKRSAEDNMADDNASETLNELKEQLDILRQRKDELQQKLESVAEKLSVAKEEEKKLQSGLKELIRTEQKLDEIMSEENLLGREEEELEQQLVNVKSKLSKAKELLGRLG